MSVTLRHTRTGLIALAAAGIFAAGTVGQRANELYGDKAQTDLDPASGPVSLAASQSARADCVNDCS